MEILKIIFYCQQRMCRQSFISETVHSHWKTELNLGLDVNTVFYFFWSKRIQSSSRHMKLCCLKSQTVKHHLFSHQPSQLPAVSQNCWKTVLSAWGIRNQFWTQEFMSSVWLYSLLPACEKPERWAAKPRVKWLPKEHLRHQHRRCTQTH